MNSSITWQMTGLSLLAILLIAAAISIGYNKRNSPERREQQRRLYVNREGRLSDATIVDVVGDTLVYQYEVGGVDYTGNQDLSTLRQMVPGRIERLVGSVAIKYMQRNPANSIVVCEVWSGLRDLHSLKHEQASSGQPEQPTL